MLSQSGFLLDYSYVHIRKEFPQFGGVFHTLYQCLLCIFNDCVWLAHMEHFHGITGALVSHFLPKP